jgi:hypothetical protein
MRLTLQKFYTTELGLHALPGIFSHTSTVLKLCIYFKLLSLFNKPSKIINLKHSLVLWPKPRPRLGSGLQVVLPLHHTILNFVSKCGSIFAVSNAMCSCVLHTYIHTYTHSDFMGLSTIQRRLEYELGHKEYWIVIYNLVLVINIYRHHRG